MPSSSVLKRPTGSLRRLRSRESRWIAADGISVRVCPDPGASLRLSAGAEPLARDCCKIRRPFFQQSIIEVIMWIVEGSAPGFAVDAAADEHVVAGNHTQEGPKVLRRQQGRAIPVYIGRTCDHGRGADRRLDVFRPIHRRLE